MTEPRLLLVIRWPDNIIAGRETVQDKVDTVLSFYFGNMVGHEGVEWEWCRLPVDLTPERAEELGLIS